MDNQGISQLNQPSQAWIESQESAFYPATESSWIPGTQYQCCQQLLS
jgi:hypothetical protein